MRALILFFLLPLVVLGVDWKKVDTLPGGQEGKNISNTLRQEYGGGEKNRATKIKEKLLDPATQSPGEGKPYILPGGQTYYGDPIMCGQGNVKDKKPFASISVNPEGKSITFRYATDPYSGSLDRTFSYSGNFLCPHGFCMVFDPNEGRHKNCRRFEFSGGNFTTVSVDSLDACVDPRLQPQPPTFYGGRLIELLLSHYRAMGKEITQSDIQGSGNTSTYYGGRLECGNEKKNPPQTQYYKNPYVMPDHALYFYHTCDPAQDPSCRAVKVFMEGNSGSEGTQTCVIERQVNPTPNTLPRTDGRICTPGAKLYPDGYSDSSVACFSGDRFFDYSSLFWLECDSDGKRYILKGWGYWEGSPCGYSGNFPPQVQVQTIMPFDQTTDWVEIGRLSVNRRKGGQGLSDGDKVSPEDLKCVSDEPTPYRVLMKNTFSNHNNVLEIRVENAPACNYFRFSSVKGLPGEVLGDCSGFDQQRCKIINEWWEDANGRRIQVIKNGNPVQMLTGCTEILRDENQKVWTSVSQTHQAPPQNCNFPPRTCRVINGQTECRQWWKKIREYRCSNPGGSEVRVDLSHYERSFLSTDYNPETGELRYTEGDDCSRPGTCTPVSRSEGRYICSVNAQQYTSSSACQSSCWLTGSCNQNTYAYRCARTGQQFPTQEQCQQNCREPAPCSTVYVCPLNNQRYPDQSSCQSACNNCQETGTCSSQTRTGTCNQEYYCSSGSVSGSNCVLQPTANCPSGYTWDSSAQRCVAPPQCSGGSYNTQRDRCEQTPTCPSGYTWNSTISACVIAPTCPSGFTWDSSLQRCTASATCPSGGTLNPTTDRCEAQPQCPSGFTWNSSRNRCERTPTCPSPGNWNSSTRRCEAQPITGCQVNSISCTFSHPQTVGTVSIPMSCSTYPNGRTRCEGYRDVSTSCCGTINLYCMYDSGLPGSNSIYGGQYYAYLNGESNSNYYNAQFCASGSASVPIWVYSFSNYAYVNISGSATQTQMCPSGYTLQGGICVNSNPSCPSGSTYDSTNGVCHTQPNTCPSGYTLQGGVCVANPACPSGSSYSASADRCVSTSYTCPTGTTFDSSAGMCRRNDFLCPSGWSADTTNRVCFASAVCPSGGTLNTSSDRCEVSGTLTCPSGWTLQNNQCVRPAEVRYRCSISGQTYQTLQACQSLCSATVYVCSFGGEYQTLQECQNACRRSLPNCCQAQGLCSADNQLYPVSTCQSQCFRPSQCSPLYNYLCSLNQQTYSTQAECENQCREQKQCNYQTVRVERYLCSKSLLEYETPESCNQACSAGGQSCVEREKRHNVGTAEGGWEEERACSTGEARYCVVRKQGQSRPKNEYDVVECQKSGDDWVCPAQGGVQVEPCRCVREMKRGFGVSAATLSVIYQALKDRSCDQ